MGFVGHLNLDSSLVFPFRCLANWLG